MGVLEHGNRDFGNHGAHGLHQRQCIMHSLGYFRVQRGVEILPRETDPQPPYIPGEGCGVVRHGDVGRGHILGVVAGNGIHGQRGVFHGPDHWAGMVQTPGKRRQPVPAHQPIGGFEAYYAAQGRRNANRSSGVAAGGDGALSRRRRRTGTAAGTSTHHFRVPRVVHVAVVRIFPGGTIGELMHIQLAQQDCARLPETVGNGAVLFGDEVVEYPGAGGGADARRVVQVLQGYGQSVQGAAVVAFLNVRFSPAGRGASLLRQQGDV